MPDDGAEEREPRSRATGKTTDTSEIPVADPDLQSILATIDDAIFIFAVERDGEGISFRFQWNNTAHESITGMTADEFAGLDPRDFLDDESAGEVVENYRTCVKLRDTIEYEETIEHDHGRVNWHTKLIPVIRDGSVVQIIGIARDVTDLKERTKYIRIVDRVFRHNIRNTLNVIQGRAQLIERDSELPDGTHATQISDSVDELLRMSEKARTITKVIIHDSGVRTQRVDHLTQQLTTDLSDLNHDGEVTISNPQPAEIIASPRLSQAIVELIENAIVHNDRSSPSIEVEVRVNEETVELVVADDGPGIPERERDILENGRSPGDLSHGSGLGVWMVYWIVRQSDGEIQVTDRSPRGSIVTIRLSRVPDDSEAPSD